MCKLEKYGNCDPETKDLEYCIFHKPNKSEDEVRLFWKKFLEKCNLAEVTDTIIMLLNELDCRGYRFPEFNIENIISEKMDNLSKEIFIVFYEKVNFSHVVFEGNVSFNRCCFLDYTDFTKAIFKKESKFEYSYFKNANFTSTIFEDSCFFNMAIFDDVFFGNTKFKDVVWFLRAKFRKSSFNFVEFGIYANFSFAIFKNNVEFAYSTFNGLAEFIGCKFEGSVSFEGAEFLGDVVFKYDDVMTYANFLGKINFRSVVFKREIDIDLPRECFRLPQAEVEAYRVQRLCYERNGRKEDADRMFVRERRALRTAKILQTKELWCQAKGIKSKLRATLSLLKAYTSSLIEWLIADLTCEYGTNWMRPIIIWLTIVLGCALLYWLTDSVSKASDPMSYLYFSVVTATTLGYGDLHPVGIGRAIASIESIIGTGMWAIYLAVFARKYMR